MIPKQSLTRLSLPYISHEDTISQTLSLSLTNYLGAKTRQDIDNCDGVFWDGNYLGLERVKIFQHSSIAEKAEILRLCNREILREVYLIEMAGVGYMAKLVSMAESAEERMLYGLFSGEEVIHLAKIGAFLPANPRLTSNNLIFHWLEYTPQIEDKAVLLFVLQVVLEGWSLSHYRNLASNCHYPQLSRILYEILADESRHHQVGLKLFHRMELNSGSEAKIIDILELFLQAMQTRPQILVSAIEKIKGQLSPSSKLRVYEELDLESHNSSQLKFLRSLMRNPNSGRIIQQLEARGAFQAFSPEQYLQ